MKHLASSIILFFLLLNTQVGSAQAHNEGDLNLNAGIGFWFGGGAGSLSFPPLSASIDYGVSDRISVGGWAGFASYTYRFSSANNWTYNYAALGARGNYHFNINNENVDLYAGASLGYYFVAVDYQNSGVTSGATANSSVALGIHGGCRYKLSEKLGIFGELGYGFTATRLGLNVKL